MDNIDLICYNYIEVIRLPVQKTCRQCNKTFTVSPCHADTATYCSRDCYTTARWGKSRKQELQCEQCGKTILVYARDIQHGRKFCSHECYGISKQGKPAHNRNRVTKQCGWCGKSFDRAASNFHSKLSFCCQHCSSMWNAEFGLHGKDHPNYIDGQSNTYGEAWPTIRKAALIKAQYKCQLCEEDKKILDVHHIIPFKFFASPKSGNHAKNLIVLCRKCHAKEEWRNRAMLPLFYAAIKQI